MSGERPKSISTISVLIFLGAVISFGLLSWGTAMAELVKLTGPWYPKLLGVSAFLSLPCAIGLWMMQRWALFLYTGTNIVAIGILMAKGHTSLLGIVGPSIAMYFGYKHLSEMD